MSEHLEKETKKSLPRWLVLAVVVATGGITAAAMFATGLRGPSMAWDRATKGVEGVWPTETQGAPAMPMQAGAPQPAMAQPQAVPVPQQAAPAQGPTPGPVVPVAAQPGVPVIVWGTPIGHGDRGPCTNCHNVVTPQGLMVPSISALSLMPHAYRGVCNNCHEVKVLPLGAPVAGVITVPPAGGAMAGNPPKRPPTEAEWMGLEVAIAAQGVLVNGVEGMAKRAGMRVGDMIMSVNAVPTRTVADFMRVTQNGALTQGAVIARREGQRLAFELGPRDAQAQPQGAQMQMQIPTQIPMQMEPQNREIQQGREIQNREIQNREIQNRENQGREIQGGMQMQGMQMQGVPMPQQGIPMQPQQLPSPAAGMGGQGVAQRAPEAPF
jgi:hypothetical protein